MRFSRSFPNSGVPVLPLSLSNLLWSTTTSFPGMEELDTVSWVAADVEFGLEPSAEIKIAS